MLIYVIIPILLIFITFIITFYLINKKKKEINKKIDELASGVVEYTPEEFFDLRNFSFGGKNKPKYTLTKNFAGVYIIYNKTKDMYYIGQSLKILNRVNNHFTGKGNGDVYADYKYGDKFTIKMIALDKSGYDSLNALERDIINKYDAFSKGYNKTKGNH